MASEAVTTKAFTGVGQTDSVIFEEGPFNLSLYATADPTAAITGTSRLERSFNSGTTWLVVETYTNAAAEKVIDNVEKSASWRVKVTAHTTNITVRLGQ
jgi:hypothetical protein